MIAAAAADDDDDDDHDDDDDDDASAFAAVAGITLSTATTAASWSSGCNRVLFTSQEDPASKIVI